MREIKFRAWDGEKMFYKSIRDMIDGDDAYEFQDYPIMQYAGVNDRNGKEIYEGDIVRVLNYLNGKEWEGHCHNSVIEFCGGKFCFKPEWCHESLRENTVEVIGNIYENPELLKETT